MAGSIVSEVIRHKTVVHLTGEASVSEAARLMRKHKVGSVLILENARLEGILTVADITYRVVAEGRNPDETSLAEVMTPHPDTVGPDCSAIDALRLMHDGGFRHLPVVQGGTVLGVVSRGDFHGAEKARLDEETHLWERIG